MKFSLFTLLIMVSIFFADRQVLQAQQQGSPLETYLTFEQNDFNGRFAVMVVTDNEYDYYVTDLTKFKERFEKIYFLNLSYKDNRLVNIDPDFEKDQMWFKAHYIFPENDILCLFDDFLKETFDVSSSWTDLQKHDWLLQFDKYTKRKDDDK